MSQSYILISRELNAQIAHDPSVHDDNKRDDALQTQQHALKPALGNCNNAELLLLTYGRKQLHQLLHQKYDRLWEHDFDFMKGLLFQPKFKKRYETKQQEELARLIKKLCSELKQGRTPQPDKMHKALQLLDKIKRVPGLDPALKSKLSQTVLELKHQVQLRLDDEPHHSPRLRR